MGHLINIANNVVQECEKTVALKTFIEGSLAEDTQSAWENFIKGPLAESNRQQQIVLGGVHPSNLTNDDSNEDYNMQATIFQQQIQYDFQLQQMNTPDLIENYSFNEPDNELHDRLVVIK